MMAQIAFIIQGKIRGKEALIHEIDKQFSAPFRVKHYITEREGHAMELTELAIREGATQVICVGGDGSLNEVANGLMKVKEKCTEEQWRKIRMGALPMGTGNDFVKTMRSPISLTGLKELIVNDTFRTIDLGLVKYQTKSSEERQRYFINITDVGMGGVVAEKLSRYSKWMGASLTYQRAILSTLLSYKHQPVQVQADNFTYEGQVMNFIIANGKYFGSGLGIAPDAEPDDGQFSIVILGGISLFDYMKNLGEVKKCRKIEHPDLQYRTAQSVKIASPLGPLPIDMDGEFIGYSPMEVTVVPEAIRFLSG